MQWGAAQRERLHRRESPLVGMELHIPREKNRCISDILGTRESSSAGVRGGKVKRTRTEEAPFVGPAREAKRALIVPLSPRPRCPPLDARCPCPAALLYLSLAYSILCQCSHCCASGFRLVCCSLLVSARPSDGFSPGAQAGSRAQMFSTTATVKC